MHARRRTRRPAVLIATLALATVVAACGTSTTANPNSTTPSAATSSSAVPLSATGPTVTVPGIEGVASTSSEASSSSSSSPRSTTTVTATASPTASSAANPTTSKAATTSQAPPPPETNADSSSAEEPPPAETTSSEPPPEVPSTDPPADPTPAPAGGGSMTKKLVVIDPGHNGQNGAHPEIIGKQVDAGFGQKKDCNTTGTQTDDGYTESLFNWKVSVLLKAALEAKGITVVMTRDSNDGVGPCVNERAAVGNDQMAAAVVSVHGDGDYTAGVHGFYVMTAEQDPAGPDMASQSMRLATDVKDSLVEGGMVPSNSIGGGTGLFKRSDLSGLNLSLRPTIMLELGNMKNSTDIALMTSDSGQAKYAEAIAAGVVKYLIGR